MVMDTWAVRVNSGKENGKTVAELMQSQMTNLLSEVYAKYQRVGSLLI